MSEPLFFISVDSKEIFSVKQIPHPSSDIFSWLSSVLISHYLCSVTDHNSSHTYTHDHAALTLARSLIFCGDGSAELADICCHNPPKYTECFIKSKKRAMQTLSHMQNAHCEWLFRSWSGAEVFTSPVRSISAQHLNMILQAWRWKVFAVIMSCVFCCTSWEGYYIGPILSGG